MKEDKQKNKVKYQKWANKFSPFLVKVIKEGIIYERNICRFTCTYRKK